MYVMYKLTNPSFFFNNNNCSWRYFLISTNLSSLGQYGRIWAWFIMYFFNIKKPMFSTPFLRHLPHCCNVWQQFLCSIWERFTAEEFHRLNVEDSCLELTPEIRVLKAVIDYVPCRRLHSLKYKNIHVKNIVNLANNKLLV